MTNEKIGESVSGVIEQMAPVLSESGYASAPILEINLNGKKYQVVLKLIPEGKPWLVRGEIEVKNE